MADLAGANGQRTEFNIVGKRNVPASFLAGNAVYGANGISHSLANSHIIICAIQNAIGKWVDPPATPDKILKALGMV